MPSTRPWVHGVLHVLREEPDAALGLAGGVEVGDDLQVLDDPLLGVPVGHAARLATALRWS